MTEVVVLRGVQVRYGSFIALDELDLTVRQGERVALVGPSGAGKSTLLGLCDGAVLPSRGSASVLGHDLAGARGRARRGVLREVGRIHQGLHLVPQLRVVHNVNAGNLGRWSVARAVRSLLRPVGVGRAQEALAAVGIADKWGVRTDRLSGGEQQRVALARVIVQDPTLVLADEPVSSLDQARAREVLSLLCGQVAGRGRGLLVSLHDFDLALSHCTRVVGLRSGRVVFDLPAADVTAAHRAALYEIERTS